jgi:hypothetical protein
VVTGMMLGWPATIRADRAARLDLTPDPDIASIIAGHRAETQLHAD